MHDNQYDSFENFIDTNEYEAKQSSREKKERLDRLLAERELYKEIEDYQLIEPKAHFYDDSYFDNL